VQPRSEAFGAPTPNGPVGQNRNNHAIVRKILEIEDEPEMYRNLTIFLRLKNFHPLPAEKGRVGVELTKRESPTSFFAMLRCRNWTDTFK
jgi:hypothetical protein